ncbi:hypothetical protein IJI99_00485 [bacterium]|nr:hypothetical protein [bacterium]
MQEHLIPQDISNYKFHLIGELDLKQFGEIMAGIIIAFLINSTNWPGPIKYTLMIIFGGLGLVAAFLPIGGQPLSHWLGVFFKNLFAPTKFYWRKTTTIPSYFTYELPPKNQAILNAVEAFNDVPVKKHRALDYFTTLDRSKVQENKDPLEIFDDANLAKITSQFAAEPTPTPTPVVAPQKMLIKPKVDNEQSVRQRQIVAPTQESMEDFLQTSNIFQPKVITDQITTVDQTLENNILAASMVAGPVPDQTPAPAGPTAMINPSLAAAPASSDISMETTITPMTMSSPQPETTTIDNSTTENSAIPTNLNVVFEQTTTIPTPNTSSVIAPAANIEINQAPLINTQPEITPTPIVDSQENITPSPEVTSPEIPDTNNIHSNAIAADPALDIDSLAQAASAHILGVKQPENSSLLLSNQ